MKLVSVKMPEALIQGMDELVKRGVYPSRSAVMRTAVRDLLKKELWPVLQQESAKSSLEEVETTI
mgnify:CR=1 FL=1